MRLHWRHLGCTALARVAIVNNFSTRVKLQYAVKAVAPGGTAHFGSATPGLVVRAFPVLCGVSQSNIKCVQHI